MSKINLKAISEPPTPATGTLVIYVDIADDRLKQKDDAGLVIPYGDNSKLLVSATDTTSDFALAKILGGAGISVTQTNTGGNETLVISGGGPMTYQGGYNASTNSPDLDTSPSGIDKGYTYTVTADGTFFTAPVEIGDLIISEIDNPTTEADWTIVEKNQVPASHIVQGYVSTVAQTFAGTKTFNDRISSPGDGSQSQRFGSNTRADGPQSLAIGSNAIADGSYSIAIGAQAESNVNGGISIGREATISNTGYRSLLIGEGSTSTHQDAFLIGDNLTSTADKQMIIGSITSEIDDFYFGTGITSTAPVDTSFYSTSGSGTDINGAGYSIEVGAGTGSGTGGKFSIYTAKASTTGSSLNTQVERFYIDETGDVVVTGGSDFIPMGTDSTAIAIGGSVTANSSSSVAIGQSAACTSAFTVCIGASAAALASGAVALGRNSNVSSGSNRAIAIGQEADANNADSIGMGHGVATTTTNQMVIGSSSMKVNDYHYGQGVVSTAPASTTFYTSGGSGTDIAGADYSIKPGAGTGTGTGGAFKVYTAEASTTGSSLNSQVERLSVDESGVLEMTDALKVIPADNQVRQGYDYAFAATVCAGINSGSGHGNTLELRHNGAITLAASSSGSVSLTPKSGGAAFFIYSFYNTYYYTNINHDSSNYTVYNHRDIGAKWKINNVEKLRLTTSGYGIGETTPTSTLHVGGSVAKPIITHTAATLTLDASHYTILADATSNVITVTLPAASTCSGRIYVIKKIDGIANDVTVDGNASETIDGATTNVISSQYASIRIQCDGTNWHTI